MLSHEDLWVLGQLDRDETVLTVAETARTTVRGPERGWCLVTDRAVVLAERNAVGMLRRRRLRRLEVVAIELERTGLGPATLVVRCSDGREERLAIDRADVAAFERIATAFGAAHTWQRGPRRDVLPWLPVGPGAIADEPDLPALPLVRWQQN